MSKLKITKVFSIGALNATDPVLLVCENPEARKCLKCCKYYTPTILDISTKRPSVYFKLCKDCRNILCENNRKFQERQKLKMLNV
jgi:hypothetical protein